VSGGGVDVVITAGAVVVGFVVCVDDVVILC